MDCCPNCGVLPERFPSLHENGRDGVKAGEIDVSHGVGEPSGLVVNPSGFKMVAGLFDPMPDEDLFLSLLAVLSLAHAANTPSRTISS